MNKNLMHLKIRNRNEKERIISLSSEKNIEAINNKNLASSVKQKKSLIKELKTRRNNEHIRENYKDKITSRVNFNKNMKNQYNKVLKLNQKKNLLLLLQKESATLNRETLQKTIKNLGLEFNVTNIAQNEYSNFVGNSNPQHNLSIEELIQRIGEIKSIENQLNNSGREEIGELRSYVESKQKMLEGPSDEILLMDLISKKCEHYPRHKGDENFEYIKKGIKNFMEDIPPPDLNQLKLMVSKRNQKSKEIPDPKNQQKVREFLLEFIKGKIKNPLLADKIMNEIETKEKDLMIKNNSPLNLNLEAMKNLFDKYYPEQNSMKNNHFNIIKPSNSVKLYSSPKESSELKLNLKNILPSLSNLENNNGNDNLDNVK